MNIETIKVIMKYYQLGSEIIYNLYLLHFYNLKLST